MLRFFRQIRKNLMEQNKIRSYFFYAFGEIALVMIGILLALQVNNLNEQSKLINEEQVILMALTEEIEGNIEELIGATERSEERIQEIKGLLKYTGPQNPDLNKTYSDSLVSHMDVYVTAEVAYSVLDDLLSTGRIHLIRNDDLKYRLSTRKQFYADEVLENEARIIKLTQDILLPYILKNYPRATVQFENYTGFQSRFNNDFKRIYHDPLFENLLIQKWIYFESGIYGYKRVIDDLNELLILVESELKS